MKGEGKIGINVIVLLLVELEVVLQGRKTGLEMIGPVLGASSAGLCRLRVACLMAGGGLLVRHELLNDLHDLHRPVLEQPRQFSLEEGCPSGDQKASGLFPVPLLDRLVLGLRRFHQLLLEQEGTLWRGLAEESTLAGLEAV